MNVRELFTNINPPAQCPDLTSAVLNLTSGQHKKVQVGNLNFFWTKSISFDASWQYKPIGAIVPLCHGAIVALRAILKNNLPNTKTRHFVYWPDLWLARLTWDLKFRYQSLRLVTLVLLIARLAIWSWPLLPLDWKIHLDDGTKTKSKVKPSLRKYNYAILYNVHGGRQPAFLTG